MKLEIIKEYHKEEYYDDIQERYSIQRKVLGFIPIFKTDFPVDFTGSQVLCMVSFILFQSCFLVATPVIYFAFSWYLGNILLLIGEVVIFRYFNFSFRKLYSTLNLAQRDIKNTLKFNTLNKQIVEKYTLNNGELIIEKRKELE